MEIINQEAEQMMNARFGQRKDNIIALATIQDGIPYVRTVNAFYENGAFYVITHGLSNKMRQIAVNPIVAVSGDWFTGHGRGVNLGYFGKAENKEIADKLRKTFAEWINNGHNDFSDENTCILCIELTDGTLLAHGKSYAVYFGD